MPAPPVCPAIPALTTSVTRAVPPQEAGPQPQPGSYPRSYGNLAGDTAYNPIRFP